MKSSPYSFNVSRERLCFAVFLLSFIIVFSPLALMIVKGQDGRLPTGNRRAAMSNDTAGQLVAEAKELTSHLDFIPGEVIVRFRPQSFSAKRATEASKVLLSREGDTAIRFEQLDAIDSTEGLYLARVEPETTAKAMVTLNTHEDVIYAEPNYIRRRLSIPNDARFGEQWGLKNTGQANYVGNFSGTVGSDIEAETAWDITTGSRDVVVAVVDEGIDINHEDLRANIWRNAGEIPGNGADDDGNGFVDDVNGYDFLHNDASVYDGVTNDTNTDRQGTHVAGIIGAQGNNGVGVAGINWQTSLMSLKILGTDDEAPTTVATVLRALLYAKQMRDLYIATGGARGANIRVMNNSYGGTGRSQAEEDMIRALGESGVLFVAAAGNNRGSNDRVPVYPACHVASNIISVAATERRDFVASFSNTGTRTVHLAAPGAEILSTTPNNSYSVLSGTSMATPMVSGAAALVLAYKSNLDVSRLRNLLMGSGEPVLGSITSPVSSGRRLNLTRALRNIDGRDDIAPAAINDFKFAFPTSQTGLQWLTPKDDTAAGGGTGKIAFFDLRYSDTAINSVADFERSFPIATPAPNQHAYFPFNNAELKVPYRHHTGFGAIRAVDEAGNVSELRILNVAIDEAVGDPYTVIESAAEPLSTGGEPLNLIADDAVKTYRLPFNFFYFQQPGASFIYPASPVIELKVSSNGALYLDFSATFSEQDMNVPTASGLQGFKMIAGLWDDLRTDRRAGDDIYVVKPDAERIIFRWQAVTYDTPLAPGVNRGENPVNFEIELRRDGTIITRYGDGNHNIAPVVGISGGAPDTYLALSHSAHGTLKDLPFAPTLTYKARFTTWAPILSPSPGNHSGELNVTATSSTEGAVIHYTTNNADPTENDPIVSVAAPIRVDRSMTIKARAFKSGQPRSLLTVGSYIIPNNNQMDISDARVVEGRMGVMSEAAYNVTLTKVSNSPVTVNYRTQDGTAIAGQDYVAVNGTLNFAPGEQVKTIKVPIISDTIPESEENFSILLDSVNGATIRTARGQCTIVNNANARKLRTFTNRVRYR